MSDIQRNDSTDIILREPELKTHQKQIELAETLNTIKGLAVQLDYLNTVEIEKVKLRMATANKKVEQLKAELAIPVETIKQEA